MTYVLVIASGLKVSLPLAGADVVSMFVFIYLGIVVGKRARFR
jgi:hypothetical protein